MKKGQPKADIALLTVAGGRGEPPEEAIRRQDRSSWGSRGLLTRRVTIVEAKLVQETRSFSAGQPTSRSCLCMWFGQYNMHQHVCNVPLTLGGVAQFYKLRPTLHFMCASR